MKTRFVIGAMAVALTCLVSSNAYALTIHDPGVVGIMEGQISGAGGSSVENEVIIANQILAMAVNSVQLVVVPAGVNCSADQGDCEYRTGANDYSGTVSGGIQQNTNPTVLTQAALGSAYILAKFDGPNAGYVLFNTADWLAAGNTSIPANGSTIWSAQGSGLSHYTYFGTQSVPDGGASLLLLGMAIGGLGMLRRRMNI